jgi:hypothetical protein
MLQPWNEIIEAQKIRSDLLKWKIIVVAALGATGLGLSTQNLPYTDLALCCIPFVCAYIDLLCRHLSLRIRVISRLWEVDRLSKANPTPDFEYIQVHERFVQAARVRGILALEDFTVVASSLVFSLALVVLPSVLETSVLPHGSLVRVSGILGIILAASIELVYRILWRRVSSIETPK